MGNCTRKAIDEEEEKHHNIQDKLMADLQFLKLKYTRKDTFAEFLQNVVPGVYLKEVAHFKSIYRIKKNIKCQRDIMYTIKVIENIFSGRLFNVKVIRRSEIYQLGMERFKAMFSNEMKALSHFKHPHMVNLINVYYEKKPDDFKLYVVTDYTSKNSLLDIINKQINMKKRFEDKDIAVIMKILIETIYRFKTEKFIHRNLCPENIFFLKEGDINTLCISNLYFGVFTDTNAKVRGLTGPLCYMAPEILQDQFYDSKVDVWSLGLISYMLLTLENPFHQLTQRDEILEHIKTDKAFRKIKDLRKVGINPDALNLTFKMLVEHQDFRISSEMLLEDRYFKENIQTVDKFSFIKYIVHDEKELTKLKFKIENLPQLHNIIFYLFFQLRNYFIEVEEIIKINELYKFFDKNNDGLLKKIELEEVLMNELVEENIITREQCMRYIDIFESVIENDYYHTSPISLMKQSFSYEFFLVTNLLIKLFTSRHEDSVKKKINIMFIEMDHDKDGTISLDELQSFFQDVVNKDYIKKTVKLILDEPSYDHNIIRDFDEMTVEDIFSFIFYECVQFTKEQERELEFEKRDRHKTRSYFTGTNNFK